MLGDLRLCFVCSNAISHCWLHAGAFRPAAVGTGCRQGQQPVACAGPLLGTQPYTSDIKPTPGNLAMQATALSGQHNVCAEARYCPLQWSLPTAVGHSKHAAGSQTPLSSN